MIVTRQLRPTSYLSCESYSCCRPNSCDSPNSSDLLEKTGVKLQNYVVHMDIRVDREQADKYRLHVGVGKDGLVGAEYDSTH